jgi:hypothetical protein
MFNTIFETIIQAMLPSRSANAILYFIENKGWFTPYRVPGGYSIPYHKWREQTIISIQKIEVLSAFISDRKGRIYYEDNMVHIRGSELKPFVSKSPREHITYICHKHRCSFVLTRYLEEFYSYQLSRYEDFKMNSKYSIPYDVWNDLFEMTPEEVDELGKVITSGFLHVNRNGEDSSVDIYL